MTKIAREQPWRSYPMRCRLNNKGATMMIYAHQTAPTQFVEANSVRFAYRRFGKTGGVPLCEPPSTVWEPYYRRHYSREQLIDDQTGHRREISKRLIENAGEIPSLIERISG